MFFNRKGGEKKWFLHVTFVTKTEAFGYTASYFYVNGVTVHARLYGKLSIMLSTQEKKALDGLMVKFVRKAGVEYKKLDTPMTKQSLSTVLKKSVIARNQEALKYCLDKLQDFYY